MNGLYVARVCIVQLFCQIVHYNQNIQKISVIKYAWDVDFIKINDLIQA